jgi:carboxymethylenebutenolidase
MLMHYAGNDARVNATRPDFEAALKAAHVDYRMFVYDGAEHAFNNDTAGARYSEAAAKLAWSRTIEFLQQALAAG